MKDILHAWYLILFTLVIALLTIPMTVLGWIHYGWLRIHYGWLRLIDLYVETLNK